jgi:predicted dehydrogenase
MLGPGSGNASAFAPVVLDQGSQTKPLGTAVVGYGYWGPNLVRNVIERADLELRVLCDQDATALHNAQRRHPGLVGDMEFDRVLADPDVEAVVIATPPATHHRLAKRALQAGKHVLVEKPLATTTADARELVEIADAEGLTLMPGHTFVYSPAVNLIKGLIADGSLGETYFVTSSRMNLGKYQGGGVVNDLAPHDLSILLHWINEPIVQVSASACSVFQADVPETAFITLSFAGGATANVQLSWLAPRKVRQMVLVGSRRMVQYDDTASDEPVRVYDRGMDFDHSPQSFGEYQLTYRSGEVIIPRVEPAEPLALELEDFARAIRTGEEPKSNAQLGVDIVQALEAANESLSRHGAPVRINGSNRFARA